MILKFHQFTDRHFQHLCNVVQDVNRRIVAAFFDPVDGLFVFPAADGKFYLAQPMLAPDTGDVAAKLFEKDRFRHAV